MYEPYFGLHRSPFNGVPGSTDLFLSSSFRDARDALHLGIDRGEGLILLSGESGTGKSTLLRQIRLALCAQHFTVFEVDGNAGPEALVQTSRMVKSIAARRACSLGAATQALDGVTGDGSRDRGERDRGGVVLLDDAHALPVSILADLCDLFAPRQAHGLPICVIAAIQPQFEKLLTGGAADGALIRSPGQHVVLRSMDETEIGAYITRKLRVSGHRGAALFSDEAVHQIARHCKGIPKRIDIVCGMSLLIASEAGATTVDGLIVREAIEDLDGHADEPTIVMEDPPRQHNADRAHTVLQTVANKSEAIAVSIIGGLRRLSARCKPYMKSGRSRVSHAAHSARKRFFSRRGPAHERTYVDSDWLELKIGLVGLGSIAFLGVLFVLFQGQSNSSDAGTGSRPSNAIKTADEKQSIDALSAQRNHETILALAQEKERLKRMLGQAQENVLANESQVNEQKVKIEKLRQEVAAGEARLAKLSKRTPARIMLPSDVVIVISGPNGEKVEVSQKDLRRRQKQAVFLETQLLPGTFEYLQSFSPGATTGAITQSDGNASPSDSAAEAILVAESPSKGRAETAAAITPAADSVRSAPLATSSATQQVGSETSSKPHESRLTKMAQTKSELVIETTKTAAFTRSEDGAPIPGIATSTVQTASVRSAAKVVAAASSPISAMSPRENVVSTEPAAAAASLDDSMLRNPATVVTNKEIASRKTQMVSAPRLLTQGNPSDESTMTAALMTPKTATVTMAALAEDSQSQLPPVEERPMPSALDSARVVAGESTGASVAHLPPPTVKVSAGATRSPDNKQRSEDAVYKVVAGDTLSSTARRFNVTVAQLREWNGLSGDRLLIAQQLRVQAPSSAAQGISAEAPREELDAPLLRAVKDGQEINVVALLDQGASIEARGEAGKTPLMLAASFGHTTMIKLLIDRGAKLDARNETGRTALSFAAWNGHEDVVLELLGRNADVDARNNDGWTPLMYASINGHARCVRILLAEGADANARNTGSQTALSAAVWNGHTEVARALLENGATVDAKTRDGWNSLLDEAWSGETSLVRLLLEYGADPKLGAKLPDSSQRPLQSSADATM